MQMCAQLAQFGGQGQQPAVALRRVAVGRTGVADGVGQAGVVGIGRNLGYCLVDGLLGSRPGRPRGIGDIQFRSATPQRGQVGGAESPPRAGEYPHRGDPGGRFGDQAQHRDHVGHLGDGQEPGQADDFDGYTTCRQRLSDGRGIGVTAYEDGRRGRRFAGRHGTVVAAGQVVSHPITFGDNIIQQRTLDGPRLGARPR